jgi:hypothetical protein
MPPTPPCRIDTSAATSWELSLCENASSCADPGTVHVSWSSAGSEKVTIHSNKNNFAYTPADPSSGAIDGAKIKHNSTSTHRLQSATLVVNPGASPYVFKCAQGQDCLTIGYDCKSSGNCQ